jgi:hypothetical protein
MVSSSAVIQSGRSPRRCIARTFAVHRPRRTPRKITSARIDEVPLSSPTPLANADDAPSSRRGSHVLAMNSRNSDSFHRCLSMMNCPLGRRLRLGTIRSRSSRERERCQHDQRQQPFGDRVDTRGMHSNELERDLWLLALWFRTKHEPDTLWRFVHETVMHWFARCPIRGQA